MSNTGAHTVFDTPRADLSTCGSLASDRAVAAIDQRQGLELTPAHGYALLTLSLASPPVSSFPRALPFTSPPAALIPFLAVRSRVDFALVYLRTIVEQKST